MLPICRELRECANVANPPAYAYTEGDSGKSSMGVNHQSATSQPHVNSNLPQGSEGNLSDQAREQDLWPVAALGFGGEQRLTLSTILSQYNTTTPTNYVFFHENVFTPVSSLPFSLKRRHSNTQWATGPVQAGLKDEGCW